MTTDEEDLRRRFDAMIAGAELSDLRKMAGDLGLLAGRDFARRTANPHLRHPRRAEAATYRIRVDLNDATPPIWRRLDVRSDLTLDQVHDVLQAAFSWFDGHLHRFAIGGEPFDAAAEWFLCPGDVEEGEDEGTPTSDVTLDETMAAPGDVLHYVYDYGDNWDLTLRLEEVLPAYDGAPAAVCIDGRRAAPSEDCGGLRDADDLAEEVDDPAHFDPAEVNESLAAGLAVLAELGLRPDLVELLGQLRRTPVGGDLLSRALGIAAVRTPEPAEMAAHLAGFQWFLDRAVGDGIPLTAAGYLRPADVEAACEVVPMVGDWIGKRNREDLTAPLADFRHALQRIGLLRKYKGTLRLTKAGKAAQADVAALWKHLAERLLDGRVDTFEHQARLLTLLCMAGDATRKSDPRVATALAFLGWRYADGRPVGGDALWPVQQELGAVLGNVADGPRRRAERDDLTPVAVQLAWVALRAPA